MKTVADALKINEIFYSIQGESTYTGRPCIFIRLAHCNLRCTYCDTTYSFYEGETMSLTEIMKQIKKYDCKLIEITGGEPLLQKEVIPFLKMLCDQEYEVLLETAGHIDISGVDRRVKRIVDLKCPSSGECDKILWSNIGFFQLKDEVKFVIGNRQDYEWSKDVLHKEKLAEHCTVLFSPVFGKMDNVVLAGWILEDNLPVRFHIQMHKYIWPPDKRGV